MTCFNCCSTLKSKEDLLDQLIARGQRLRSEIVKTLVRNEPINLEEDSTTVLNEANIRAFLQGDEMSRDEELHTLETLRSMSAVDLCKITDRTYHSNETCFCEFCSGPREESVITEKVSSRNCDSFLKYVDTVKVAIGSLILSDSGHKKIADSGGGFPTFFLEYQLPDLFTKTTRSRIDTGLQSNIGRICVRTTQAQTINFRHMSMYDVSHLNEDKLKALIKFRLSFRNPKKSSVQLGVASFNLSNVRTLNEFICTQDIDFKLENTPITVAKLKICVQFGCGRLYFGHDFLKAVSDDKENTVEKMTATESFRWSPPLKKVEEKNTQKTSLVKAKIPPRVTAEMNNAKLILFGSLYVSEVYQESLLHNFRENSLVVEVFERSSPRKFLIGVTSLSLHQFYLTYRSSTIVKYLIEKPFPEIAADGWENAIDPLTNEVIGQLHVLLALGTKEQIENLEKDRGFKRNRVRKKLQPKTVEIGVQAKVEMEPELDAFLQANLPKENPTPQVRSTNDLLDSLQKALKEKPEAPFFRAQIAINNAAHLSNRRKCKSRKSKQRSGKPEDVLPSTYVTFESWNGELKMTKIVPRNTDPKWDFQAEVCLSSELLTKKQQFLVFKVWRKSNSTNMVPNMQVDHIIGVATVNLAALLCGLPNIKGWYNINDLSNKSHGQINVHVTPLEPLDRFQIQDSMCCDEDSAADSLATNDLLGRALKRKFTELDDITQRLRSRLSKVTNESDTSNDEFADDFERDINTLCVEDDYDTLDFEQQACNFNLDHLKDVGLLQTNLVDSKQKIDVLLEKLTLISKENGRYVSGSSRSSQD